MTRNELLELKGELKEYAIEQLIDFCYDNELEYIVQSFISSDYLDELVKERVEENGWQGVACMLEDINYMNDDYYFMDGYGNIRDVDSSDIYDVIDDILTYESDLLEEEE